MDSDRILEFLSKLAPLIITIFLFVNMQVMTSQNNDNIAELKKEVKELRCDITNLGKEFEQVKTIIRLKVR